MAKRFLTYDTQNPPSNVNEQGVMAGGSGGSAKIVLFKESAEGLQFYGEERYATLEEVAEAYFEGDAYVVSNTTWQERFPRKIIAFDDVNGNVCALAATLYTDKIVSYKIYGTNLEDGAYAWLDRISAIMQKYIPGVKIE